MNIIMEQNINELQELREQLAALNQKLDKQAEINDNMIRRALDASIGRLQSLGSKKFFWCIIATVVVLIITIFQGVSLALIIATALFMGINTYMGYVLMQKEKSMDGSSDLIGTMNKVLDYKKYNRDTTLIMLPVAILWAVWYVADIGRVLGLTATKEYAGLAIACLVGGIIGGIIGYFTAYRPSMKEADEILGQIKEIEGNI